MRNNSVNVSVVLLTYNPDLVKIMRTLKSIVLQEGVSYELIICDDGSVNTFRNEIDSFLKKSNFDNYCWIEHEKNVGTVMNLLDGVRQSNGLYVKDIGQGDFFANQFVLKSLYNCAIHNDYKGLFSEAIHFVNEKESIRIVKERAFPQNVRQFRSNKQLLKNYVKCNDFVNGATTFFERSVFLNYLEEISGKVKLLEDKIIKLMIMDDIKLGFFKKATVFYETDSGVSTTNSDLRAQFYSDNLEIIELMKKRLSYSISNRHLMNLLRIDAFRSEGNLISYLNWVLRDFDILLFELKKRLFTRKTIINYDQSFIIKCINCEVNNASN